ncbi:MAG: hypothetical protein P8O16_18600 [Algoriphagus sp.]|uniref:hypothetical protein n=1 Tax=Algoriphagus sp. TaxID=1872435 RepID=UPI00260B535D|nr:hypothetical protein [Algoriphagus sp.]MDG1279296.1 hypothetical protein [Algoriphagus sp.]
MSLLKEENKFWQRHFRIEKLEDIPKNWSRYTSIDSEKDDTFLYFLSLRVLSILEIRLKDTFVTDEGIKHICGFEDLKILYLRKHKEITKKSIPYFNQMKSLESLNITKTKITLTDLSDLLDNQSLKEVFLSSNESDENLIEKAFVLKERMPKCNIYLNTSFVTDTSGEPIDPIF